MTANTMFWIIGIAVVFYLTNRLSQLSMALHDERRNRQLLERKQAELEKDLDQRGHRLDVLLSTISEVVLRVDRLGRVLGGNELANAVFHFDKSPALPQSMLIFYRENDWIEQYQRAVKALPEKHELPEMHIRGRIFLPKLAPLGDKEALLICMDITEHTKLQQEQKSLLENLMHDLKTPLTSLLGYARSIEVFAEDDALRSEAVAVIAQEAKHINDLLNSVLTLNQIEHQQHGGHEPSDVKLVCRQVWDSLSYGMNQKSINLELKVADEALHTSMAEADLYRVLMNVAKNAIKFSPKNAMVKCEVSGQKKKVYIEIRDQGPGIPESHISRVTERFYCVDGVRSRDREKGHGLGLAIVKEILERDGGDLKLSNAHEGGLIVRITLPQALNDKA